MKRLLITGLMVVFWVTTAQAAPVKLLHLCSTPDGATGVSASYLAEVAAKYNVATIQTSCGKTLTKTMRQVAEGKADITASPFILNFLMMKGLGPYAGLGKKKGAELAGNLRVLYSYNIGLFYWWLLSQRELTVGKNFEERQYLMGPLEVVQQQQLKASYST